MGDIQKKLLPHPLAPLLKALGMTRGTEAAGATRKHKQAFFTAVRTPDAGKPATGITAVEIALHDFFNDRPEETVLLLEAALVLREEAVEIVEEHPIEDRPLGMARAIDSSHEGRMASRNVPLSWIRPLLPEKTGKAPVWQAKSGRESVNLSCLSNRRMETTGNRERQREYSTAGMKSEMTLSPPLARQLSSIALTKLCLLSGVTFS